MPQDRQRRLEELFELVVHLGAEEREGFYRRHCPDDAALRQELESLVAHHDHATEDFLRSPLLVDAVGAGEETQIVPDPLPGGPREPMPERIGPYVVLEKIGEGGMGAVYLGEHARAVKRRVAIKVVKLGMDSAEVLARFETERRALELMDHPGIARIVDSGTTDEGRPYFVMEHVEGRPLHRYCDEERLSVDRRLELFGRICEAVQHAHQKGVIHRDLKPSNVLVADLDGTPVPKLIDFGIACATSEAGVDWARKTRAHQVLGTLHYMSPEQAAPAGGDVDTRSDVYSLGVLLYDLLAGVLPVDAEQLRDRSPAEVQRMLWEQEPDPPSRRLTRIDGDTTVTLASRRGLDARALVRRLSGDLDWIICKAMERDRDRRYPTASELGADIRRHQAHEPVLAGPPDLRYRLVKAVRRNRAAFAASLLAAVALVLGTVGASWGFLAASRQRDEARAQQQEAEEAERVARTERTRAMEERRRADEQRELAVQQSLAAQAERARAEEQSRAAEEARELAEAAAEQSEALTAFLVDTISLADPEIALSPDLSLSSVLRSAGEKVGQVFAGDPRAEIDLRVAFGRAFHSAGELELAEKHLSRALDLQRGQVTTSPEELYETTWRLARVYWTSGSADDRVRRLEAFELAAGLLADRYLDLGDRLYDLWERLLQGDVEGAKLQLGELERVAEESLGAENELEWLLVADGLEFLGSEYGYAPVPDRLGAADYLEAALRIRRQHQREIHPHIVGLLRALVDVLNENGRYEQAEELVERTIELQSASLPKGHWRIAATRSLFGEALSGQGRTAEAEQVLLESHRAIVAARGSDGIEGIDSLYRLVRHFSRSGDPGRAAVYREQLAGALARSPNAPWRLGLIDAAFGPEHAELFEALESFELWFGDEAAGRRADEQLVEDYENMLAHLLAAWEETLGPDDPRSVLVARRLAEYTFLPQYLDPVLHNAIQQRILDVLQPYQGSFPGAVSDTWRELAGSALSTDDVELAADRYRHALEVLEDASSTPDFDLLRVSAELAACLLWTDRGEEAERLLVGRWQDTVDAFGPSHDVSVQALWALVALYDRLDTPTAATKYLERHLSEPIEADVNPGRLSQVAWLVLRSPDFEPGLYERARAAAARALELEPAVADLQSDVGSALYRLGDYEGALEQLEASEALVEDLEMPHCAFLVMTLAHVGQKGRARELMKRLEERYSEAEPDAASGWERLLAEARAQLPEGG